MSDNNFDYKQFSVMKILSPLAAYADEQDLSFEKMFSDIKKCVDEISSFAKDKIDNYEKDKIYIQRSMYEVMADTFLNDYLLNDSINVDKHIDNAKKTLTQIVSESNAYNKNLVSLSMSSIFRVMNESYQFHNSLYFAEKIRFSDVVRLNDIILNSALKNILGVLYLYEYNINNSNVDLGEKFNKEFLCESANMASNIYADCLASLFEKLSNEKDEVKLYIKTPQKFIKKVEKLFIEYFTKLQMGGQKIVEEL